MCIFVIVYTYMFMNIYLYMCACLLTHKYVWHINIRRRVLSYTNELRHKCIVIYDIKVLTIYFYYKQKNISTH